MKRVCSAVTNGRPCHGFSEQTPANPYRCERHRRPSPSLRGYDRAYRDRRAPLIGRPCELRLPGCTGIADTADHVTPIVEGGTHGRLRPACLHCNSSRRDGRNEAP